MVLYVDPVLCMPTYRDRRQSIDMYSHGLQPHPYFTAAHILQVAAPQQAQAFKKCYMAKIVEQEHYASSDCQAYVTAMANALKARQCYPLQ